MCGVKLMDKKNTEESIVMLGLKETKDKLAKANGVRWYGHVLRREEDDILRKALCSLQGGRPEKEQTVDEDLEKSS